VANPQPTGNAEKGGTWDILQLIPPSPQRPKLALTETSLKTYSGVLGFAPKVDFTTGLFLYSVSIGDFNGDGKPDLATANYGNNSNTVSILLNTTTTGATTPTFASIGDFTTGSTPVSVSIGDFNGDNKPDLAVANSGSGNVSILLNTTTYTTSIATTPTFATKVDFTTGTKPYSVSIGDFNGDGKPDLAVANGGDDTASIFLNGVIPKVTAVTATTPDGSYGVDSTIAITVTFDAAVTVTGTPQLQLETGATDQFATYASGTGGTALTFNYVVKAGDTSADLQYLSTTALTPNGGTIKDSLAVDVDAVLTLPALASANSLGGSKAIVVDGVAPTVTLTSTSAATVNGLFNVTATFSENVSNFINTDITVANGNVSNFATVDAKTYTFDVTPTADGNVTVDIPAAKATDIAGNNNTAANQLTRTADITAPTVSLTSPSTPTVNGLFNVTATFSENVSNFINTDITVANGNVSNFATVDAKTYTFDVTPTADGNVTVDIPAAKATDIAGNNNTAANQLTRTADITAPTVSLTSPSTPTVNGLFTVTATFSENVSNFINTDITVANGNVSNFTTVDAKTYTFDVTPTADGNVTVDIPAAKATDTAGNNNTAAPQLSRTANITPPTVTLTSPSAATVTGLFSVTATFTEDVIGFDNTDITVANATASNFVKVDAKTYTFDVTPTASGNVTVDIPAAKATDIAGNNNTAAIQLTRTADVTAPTANLGAISNITTAGGTSQSLTVTFSDNNAVDVSSLDSSDVLINWSGGDISAQFVSVDTNSNGTPRTATYSFIPPGGSWDDTDNATYTVKLQGSQVKDALGNLNAATSLGTFNVNVAVPKPIPIPLVTPSVTTTPTPRTIIINTPSVGNIDRGEPTNYPQNQVVDNQYLLSDNDDTSIPQSAFGKPIFGLSGNDKLTGSDGNDTIHGNRGADTIDGGGGNDSLFGGKKSDQLSGGNGDDFLSGNNDNDTVTGGDDNDTLHGGKENDVLIGGIGDDELWGDQGFNVLTGGAGKDTFVLQYTATNPSQSDVITDFTSDDKIKLIGVNFSQLTFESVNVILDGANAVDSTVIKSGNDYLGVVYNVNQTALNSSSFL